MGRGLGQRQRQVLAVLEGIAEFHGDAYVLLRSLARQDPSVVRDAGTGDLAMERVDTSELESTRRAVRTLEQRGLVETARATLGQRHHRLVRLRKNDRIRDVPIEVDNNLSTKLKIEENIRNESCRRGGSRIRLQHVMRSHMESATLVNMNGDAEAYRGVYIYDQDGYTSPGLSTVQPEKTIEEIDREVREEIDKEIERRVSERLQQYSGQHCHCSRSHSKPASEQRTSELVNELIELLSDSYIAALQTNG